MTAAYPLSLPAPMSFGLKPTSQLAMSAGDDMGPIDYRRRTQQTTAIASVTFRFVNDQYKVFLAWWQDTLLYGHKWFTINLPSARGNVTHYAKFATKFMASKRGFRYIEVTADLELRERQIDAPIVVNPFVPQIIDFALLATPGNNSAAAYVAPPTSVRISVDPDKTFVMTLRDDGPFLAWSGYPSDSIAKPWILSIAWRAIAPGGGITDVLATVNNSLAEATPAAVFPQWIPLTFTGKTDYYFWLNDPNPTDNRGGLSLRMTEQEP